jgi:hypothetical protein
MPAPTASPQNEFSALGAWKRNNLQHSMLRRTRRPFSRARHGRALQSLHFEPLSR